jgi:hypothetical protein
MTHDEIIAVLEAHRDGKPLIKHCKANGIEFRLRWGIVPCWG